MQHMGESIIGGGKVLSQMTVFHTITNNVVNVIQEYYKNIMQMK